MEPGQLYIVATPIGNLEDITLRALRILKEVNVIAAEDTRRTKKLLAHFGILGKRLITFHDHNKERKTPHLLRLFRAGNSIALVSDAGTPGISDPAFYLVRAAIETRIRVIPVPGANAAIAALASSGLPTDSFNFIGFLPKKKGQRMKLLAALAASMNTVICYESPHRIESTLKMMAEVMPEYQLVIARELTKLHESFLRGTVEDVYKLVKKKPLKGEIVLLFHRPVG